jgi:hypothetical protein
MDMDVDVRKIGYIEYGCGCGWHIQNHYQYSKKNGYRCLNKDHKISIETQFSRPKLIREKNLKEFPPLKFRFTEYHRVSLFLMAFHAKLQNLVIICCSTFKIKNLFFQIFYFNFSK